MRSRQHPGRQGCFSKKLNGFATAEQSFPFSVLEADASSTGYGGVLLLACKEVRK